MDSSANTTAPNPPAGLPQLPHGVTMENTYGAMLLGTFVSLILYGVLLHQIYSYVRVHSADSRWIKCYVALILLLDTAHTVVIISMCYSKLVTHYFNVYYLATMDWPLAVVTIVISVNIVACQSFFAYRVYRIGRKSRMVVWFCMVCQGAGFGLCIAFTVKAFQAAMWEALSDKYASWISIALGFTVFIDTALAGVLVFVLHRSRTGLKSTNSLLDTLIAYALTTGLLTDVINILGFVFALVSSQTLYYAAFNTLVSKVYTNSVMAALNFRRPREPAWTHYTGTLFPDSKDDHISLPGMSRPREVDGQGKGPYNAPISRFSGNAIEIKAELVSSLSTNSDEQVDADVGDLGRGEEGR
ncbi:hypothetical protein V8D89_001625 [Ganoderma adspersum]